MLLSVCGCVSVYPPPPSLLGNCSVKVPLSLLGKGSIKIPTTSCWPTFLFWKNRVGSCILWNHLAVCVCPYNCSVFSAVRIVSKESRRVVLPGTSCSLYLYCALGNQKPLPVLRDWTDSWWCLLRNEWSCISITFTLYGKFTTDSISLHVESQVRVWDYSVIRRYYPLQLISHH
jgi:hypothetical protein